MQQIIQDVTPVVVTRRPPTRAAHTVVLRAAHHHHRDASRRVHSARGTRQPCARSAKSLPTSGRSRTRPAFPPGLQLGSDGTISDVEGVSAEAGRYPFTGPGHRQHREIPAARPGEFNVVSRLGILTPSIFERVARVPPHCVRGPDRYAAQPQAQGGASDLLLEPVRSAHRHAVQHGDRAHLWYAVRSEPPRPCICR